MPRRGRFVKETPAPDAKYGNRTLAKFINRVMLCGKRSIAERIVYDSFDRIERDANRPAIEVFEQAMRNAMPVLEVKPRRVGGATYQVPVEIKGDRRMALAMRWLLQSAKARSGRSMAERLAAELLDAARNQGNTIKRREDTHRMAEANKAFAHYRW
jgi:small subunit ribosomal protein S7